MSLFRYGRRRTKTRGGGKCNQTINLINERNRQVLEWIYSLPLARDAFSLSVESQERCKYRGTQNILDALLLRRTWPDLFFLLSNTTRGWTRAPDNTGKWFDGCDCDVVLFDGEWIWGTSACLGFLMLLQLRPPLCWPTACICENSYLLWSPLTERGV